jgi:hypothetical protein
VVEAQHVKNLLGLEANVGVDEQEMRRGGRRSLFAWRPFCARANANSMTHGKAAGGGAVRHSPLPATGVLPNALWRVLDSAWALASRCAVQTTDNSACFGVRCEGLPIHPPVPGQKSFASATDCESRCCLRRWRALARWR